MTLQSFINILKNTPTQIAFSETISIIETLYDFNPSAFTNGNLQNSKTENLGSCKVIAFGMKQGFTKEETLACFGHYYFNDVLQNPNGTDHQNIRNFMKTGFEGISFQDEVLTSKN
ncbi:HopJ type III effector protein [Tenacibaculum sp. nBUS_03]|uniref:HopJ type III effector protein n=1 Tax=Tenacibaculum sp. nBUS_03 TaxID=3395320 RepID=UPI003EBCBAD9